METAQIMTDKATLAKVKRMAAEKNMSVSAFIRDLADKAAPPAYSISDQLFDLSGYMKYISDRVDSLEKGFVDLNDSLVKHFSILETAITKRFASLEEDIAEIQAELHPVEDPSPEEIAAIEAHKDSDSFDTDFTVISGAPIPPGGMPWETEHSMKGKKRKND